MRISEQREADRRMGERAQAVFVKHRLPNVEYTFESQVGPKGQIIITWSPK